MTSGTSPLSRSERRALTRMAILDSARALFREAGYQRTTIRATARRAGVDPALVMQHFGSKEALFQAAAAVDFDLAGCLPGPPDELGGRVLSYLLQQLDKQPDAMLATLRSMLTHERAAETVRYAFLDAGAVKIAGALDGDEAALRSGLICTLLVGLIVTRHLLKIDEVAQASPERLIALLEPCLFPLVRGDGTPAAVSSG